MQFSESASTSASDLGCPLKYVRLQTLILDMGAEISDSGEVTTFGNDDEAVEAAESGVAVSCRPLR